MAMDHSEILQALYDSEINFSLRAYWDLGVDWKLGDEMNGFRAEGRAQSVRGAVIALANAALAHFPGSAFAGRFLGGAGT
jgi:hypothetical protein